MVRDSLVEIYEGGTFGLDPSLENYIIEYCTCRFFNERPFELICISVL